MERSNITSWRDQTSHAGYLSSTNTKQKEYDEMDTLTDEESVINEYELLSKLMACQIETASRTKILPDQHNIGESNTPGNIPYNTPGHTPKTPNIERKTSARYLSLTRIKYQYLRFYQ